MKFPRHWAHARDEKSGITAWGWSDDGATFAQAAARERLARMVQKVAAGGFAALERYAYGERALREPVLEEFAGAAVTRNALGCEVLNTERTMFVDIDLPDASNPGFIGRLFGQKATDPEGEALARIEAWLQRNGDWGFRVYRTRAGLRLMATRASVAPQDGEGVMSALGADPKYVQLCRSQQSYRARLTPKPWRLGVSRPDEWPFENLEIERRFQDWKRDYDEKRKGFATCRFLRSLGKPGGAEPIIALHDTRTQAAMDLPLA